MKPNFDEVNKKVVMPEKEIPVPAEEHEPKVSGDSVELKPGEFVKAHPPLQLERFCRTTQERLDIKYLPQEARGVGLTLVVEHVKDNDMKAELVDVDLKEIFAGAVKFAHELTPEERIERIHLLESFVTRAKTEIAGIRTKNDIDFREFDAEKKARLRELDLKYDKGRKTLKDGTVSGTRVRTSGKKAAGKSPLEKQVLMLHKLSFDAAAIVEKMALMQKVTLDVAAVQAIIDGE